MDEQMFQAQAKYIQTKGGEGKPKLLEKKRVRVDDARKKSI